MCCGAGLSIKKKQEKDRIAAVFFGDGSSNEGAVFEAFNLAAVWNLPVLFVCVNNTYGMVHPNCQSHEGHGYFKAALPFGMPSRTVDGTIS